jgi:EmrB/QacA subfamily drug resistance transporter
MPTSARVSWSALAVTSIALFAVYLDTTVLFVAFPSIEATFPSVSSATLSWTLNAYTVVFGALLVPAGQLADRLGRKRIFLAGTVVFTAGSVLCGVAPTVGLLVAARVLQSVGAAMSVPSSLALVLTAMPREKRAIAASIWGAVGALSAAIGPALGSAIVESAGWRWAFLLNLPVGVAAFVLGRRRLVESRGDGTHARPDVLGIALLVAGLGLLALGIVQGPAWGWTSAQTFGALLGAVVLLAGFGLASRVAAAPVIDFSLFRDRNYQLANAAMLVFSVAFNVMFLGYVFFLTRVWGYSILKAGLAVTPGPLMVIPVALFAGRLAARRGHRGAIAVGGLVYALGGVLLLRAPMSPDYLGSWLPAALVSGVGVGLVFPSLSGAAVHGLPPARFGLGSAVSQAIRQIGGVLGVATIIALLAHRPGFAGFQSVFAVLVGGGVIVAAIGIGIRTGPAVSKKVVVVPAVESASGG